MKLFVVYEYDYDHFAIVGIFSTREAADAERAYCEEAARRFELFPNRYAIEDHVLDEARALVRVGKKADGTLTYVGFSASFHREDERAGAVRTFDDALEDGTVCEALQRELPDFTNPPPTDELTRRLLAQREAS